MKKIIALFVIPLLLNACVTKTKYDALFNQNSKLNGDLQETLAKNVTLSNQLSQFKDVNQGLKDQIMKYKSDLLELNSNISLKNKEIKEQKDFQDSYVKNSKSKRELLVNEINKRNKELTDKEKALSLREAKLAILKADLKILESSLENTKKNLALKTAEIKKREYKINLLQAQINKRDSILNGLKSSISTALNGFKNEGLEVSEKNGKVYIQMKDNLLFQSASIVVGKKGKDALLKLAKVLNSKENIDIMVEGHTDNVPMQTAQIKDNWDLSVLRATSIIRVLTKEGKVNPKRIVAAGRSEFTPIDANDNKEARKKNRRTEIIVIPNMQRFYTLLNK